VPAIFTPSARSSTARSRKPNFFATITRVLTGENVLLDSLPAQLRDQLHVKDLTPTEFAILSLIARFLGRYFQDADVLAIAGAYERASQMRVASTLVPALAGEAFRYVVPAAPTPTLVPVPVPTLNPAVQPVAIAPSKATVQGSGKNTRLVFEGKATGGAQIVQVKVTIDGRRVSVKGKNKWTAVIKTKQLQRFIGSNPKTVNFAVIVRDSNGFTNATVRRVKVPPLG
jgi:hypothetical protein